jgi:hypothetical protein
MTEYFDWHPEEYPKLTPFRDTRIARFAKKVLSFEYTPQVIGVTIGLLLWPIIMRDDPVSETPVVTVCDATTGADTDGVDLPNIPGEISQQMESRMTVHGLDVDENSCQAVEPDDSGTYNVHLSPGEKSTTIVIGRYSFVIRSAITPQS